MHSIHESKNISRAQKKPIFKRKEPSNFFHDSTIEERGNGKKLSSLKEGKMCRFLLF